MSTVEVLQAKRLQLTDQLRTARDEDEREIVRKDLIRIDIALNLLTEQSTATVRKPAKLV